MLKKLPKIVPVIQPKIDWNNYILSIDSLTGRSPTRLTDKEGQPIGSYNTFIGSVGFFAQGIPPDKLSNAYLKLLDFAFLIEFFDEKDYINVLTLTELYSISNISQERDLNFVAIIKGNIFQWKEACFRLTDESQTVQLRYTFDAIFLYLESLGIQLNARKIPLKDQTFVLEDKR